MRSPDEDEPLLRFFGYEHLEEPMRGVSLRFHHLAGVVVCTVPRSPERTVCLRKLLEAKDAAVRAVLPLAP